MSWLSSLAGGAKKAAVGVGHAVGKVASNPLVTGAAGLLGGPLAGAAVGGIGRLIAPGGNLGNAAGGAALGGVAGLAGNGIKSLLAARGAGGAASGGIADASTPGGVEVGGTDWSSILKQGVSGAGNFLTGQVGGSGMNPLTMGLAGLQTANAANLGNKANEFADKGYGYATKSYDDRAPLRGAGIAGLLRPRPMQNTNTLSAIRAKNPVAARAGG